MTGSKQVKRRAPSTLASQGPAVPRRASRALVVASVALVAVSCARPHDRAAPTEKRTAPAAWAVAATKSQTARGASADVEAGVPERAPGRGPVAPVPPLRYQGYENPRFGFSVDVPTFFAAGPPPTNGDGLEWTWGDLATMTASGMNAIGMKTADLCGAWPHRAGVRASKVTRSACWVTGVDGGRIYWERTVLAGDVFTSLRLTYDERLKKAFDPLVAHVSASFRPFRCEGGAIDACGQCFPRCKSTADCAGKAACEPITCWGAEPDGHYGTGCVDPDDQFIIRRGVMTLEDAP